MSENTNSNAETTSALAWTENSRTSLAVDVLRESKLLLELAIKANEAENQDADDTLEIMRGLAVRVKQLNEVATMAISDSVDLQEMKDIAYGNC